MKKTLGVLLAAPFAVALLVFAGIVVLENVVAVDIAGIRWDYRDQEAFKVREQGYLLEAEPIINSDLELSPGNDLIWTVSNIDQSEETYAVIIHDNDEFYLEAKKEGDVRLTCQNEKGTVSRSLNAKIYENGAIIINDLNAPASGTSFYSLRKYGEYDFDDVGAKQEAKITLEVESFSDVQKDEAILISASSNVTYKNGEVTIKGSGIATLDFALKEMEFITQSYTFEIVENGVNVYDYDDLLLATNDSENGEIVCLQRNLLSLSSTYKKDGSGAYTNEFLSANTRLFGHYDFALQKMNSFKDDVFSFQTTYQSKYIEEYVLHEENNDPSKLEERKRLYAGIHVQKDFYGNGFRISMQELCYPNHGKINSYTGVLTPGEEDLFHGPLTFISIGLIDYPVMKSYGQDNVGLYLDGDNLVLDDVALQNVDDTNNLYNLEYVGTVVDIKGKNVKISNSFIRNGRNNVRIQDGDGFELSNSLVENCREFLLKIGSDSYLETDDNKTISIQYGGEKFNGSISSFMDKENGYADYLLTSALTDRDYALGALDALNIMQSGLDADVSTIKPYQLTVEDTLFGRSGILPIAFESYFNGPYLYNGLPSFVETVMSMLPEAPSFLPDKIGGTSYPNELTLKGDIRFYDWKAGDSIDVSCLVEERLGELLSGYFEGRLPIDSYFPLKNLLLREAKNKGYLYDVSEGEEIKSYVCPIAGFYGGGLNLSSLIYEENELPIGEEISIDFAKACLSGDGLTPTENGLAEILARCVPLATGFHPFRFYLSTRGEGVPSTFGQSPDVSILYSRGGNL